MECIFCKIIAGQSPADIIYRDELVLAFRDIHPLASTHILIIPNRHIDSVNELADTDGDLAGHMVLVARKLAEQQGVAVSGYRLMINTGRQGGQTIPHLHLHLIAGKLTRFLLG